MTFERNERTIIKESHHGKNHSKEKNYKRENTENLQVGQVLVPETQYDPLLR